MYRKTITALAAAIGLAAGTASAETINLTIASSHATVIPWVGVLKNHVQPEFNKRLKEAGLDLQVEWTEGYGGSLFKFQNTLEAVQDGLTDIGWVGTLWEGSKMPLQNVTYFTPFVTDDLHGLLAVLNDMNRNDPAFQKGWADNNQVFLGASGNETYHLFTNFPVNSLADLNGRKIIAPGPAATWLQGTGAVAVDGALPTYYTQLKTGVADGVVVMVTGAFPFKLHEVAPYMTKVGLGAMVHGAMAINKDTWDSLPPKAQEILKQLGDEYSKLNADEVMARYGVFQEKMQAEGLKISELPAAEREKWIAGLPSLGKNWAKATDEKGVPASQALASFMEKARARIGKPARDWDKE